MVSCDRRRRVDMMGRGETRYFITSRRVSPHFIHLGGFIMTHLADVRSDLALSPLPGGARGLFRWVCTSNPFYVLSALLFCLGLWVSFGGQVVASQTWALLSGMGGYTLLLAVTACLLVRYVGVWDDVRTVLLLAVLIFPPTPVTFYHVLPP